MLVNHNSSLDEALKRCDNEPVQFIGSIQSDGVLIAVDASDCVRVVSANLADILHGKPEQAIGMSIVQVIGEMAWQVVCSLGALEQNQPPVPVMLPLQHGDDTLLRQAFVHRSETKVIIEIEGDTADHLTSQVDLDATSRVLSALLANTRNLQTYVVQLAQQVQQLTGFDRVMVYQFDHQWNGQVIAESAHGQMDSFLGHHFPASDIPEPARCLYAKNLVRMLSNRNAPSVALVASPQTLATLDLSYSVLRSMSPVHLVYLKNLGVVSSVSVSLLQHGKLWGLVVCHHRTPKRMPLKLRDSLELIARTAAIRLSALAFDASLNFQVNLRGLTHDVLDWTQHSSNLSTLGIFLQDQLLSAVHATGLAILTDRDRVHFGQTPPDNALSDLQYWLPSSHLARSTFSTHALATEYPDVAAYCNNAAGLLVIPLDETGTQVALWFRTEVVRSIEWAGIDHKTLIDDDLGPRLEPRSSFARWVQTRRGESEPWTALQVDAAHTLSMTLSWILARQRLRQSELRYRSLIDWSPDAIVVHQQGNIVYVNPAAVKMFGATSERELLGSPVVDHVHPDHRNTVFARLQRNQTDNIDTPLLDEKFIKLNGSTMDVELKSMSITFDAEPACQLAMRDVTERKIIEDQLRVSAHALKSISQGVLITSVDKRIVSVNDAFMRITGYSRAEVMGCDRDVLLGPLTDTNTVEAMNLALLQETVFHGEILNYCKDGRPFWNESTISPLRNQMGQLTHFVSIVRDITLRKITEKKIKLAASVFTHAREGIFIAEADSTIIDVNDTFTHITGYAREEVLGKKPNLLQSGRHTSEFYAAMWRDLNKKGHWQGEIWNKKKNGVIYPEILSISAVLDADGVIQHYVGLFTDISVIKGHESQLEKMAHFDPLTGLPNRALLGDRLRQAMVLAQRRAQQLAVVTLDLDGFKSINDAYGHEVGDHLLVIVANRIMQSLRDGDTLARLGGDEFVAIFNNLPDLSACESMLNRLLLAAAEPVQVGEHLLQVSASLGVAFFPQSQTVDADVLIRQANQVMYQAKQAGKNLYRIFDADYDRSVRNHHESIKRLTQALQNEEFVLYYQPKVNMRSGCVIGAEALIRWQHPEKGLLPPAAFLPEMEDNPLAIQVGEWVINTALTQIEQWQAQGLQLAVSVNVGVMQLQQADFVDRLRALLTAHPKVKPSSLEMEVLETSALEDVIRVTHVIKMCQSMGVKFALDDFGTGYSSLTYLKRLPVSMLKIDQSFVRGMLDDSDDLSILEGILGMAQAFRRDVIAEGVETVAHGAMLLQLGCDLAQGYGIARPMPADKLQDWVLNWRVDSSWCNLQVLSRSDLPLLYAAADHRAWVLLLEKYLRDNSSELPLLNPFECRFGRWLEGEGRPQHAHKLSFVLVVHLHQKVHALGSAICFHHDKGQRSQAQALMPEIYKLRDALLVELMTLVRQ